MSGFRVVIAGGGIAAVEGLLRLRRLTGDSLEITMLAPEPELRYRPLAVQEPFAGPGARRYPLARIAGDTRANLVQDALESVDPDGQLVHTAAGEKHRYDALLLAYGARSVSPFHHATTFDDAHADDTYLGIVRGIEGGYTKAVGLIVPDGPAWALPVYELALQTADRAYDSNFDDVTVTVVTPESAPLEVFGTAVSEAAREALVSAGVRLLTGAGADVPESGRLVVDPGGHELEPATVVSLPRIEGRALRGSLIAGERRRLFFQARLEDGRAVDSELLDAPDWESDEKIVAAELGPYLHGLDQRG